MPSVVGCIGTLLVGMASTLSTCVSAFEALLGLPGDQIRQREQWKRGSRLMRLGIGGGMDGGLYY